LAKQLDTIALAPNQQQALDELRRRLPAAFDIENLMLYGSIVRGEADEESDLDLLVVTTRPLSRRARHEITNVVFDVNLHYDTNFSTLVVDCQAWETGPLSVLPLKDAILQEGIAL
jgi:predicted nucleotidyltransferase